MSDEKTVKLVGAFASPYSRKMRAVLRYRRIPFRWILRGSPADLDTPAVPVALIPVLVLPSPLGDTAMIDSTFQIRRLESDYPARAVTPPIPPSRSWMRSSRTTPTSG